MIIVKTIRVNFDIRSVTIGIIIWTINKQQSLMFTIYNGGAYLTWMTFFQKALRWVYFVCKIILQSVPGTNQYQVIRVTVLAHWNNRSLWYCWQSLTTDYEWDALYPLCHTATQITKQLTLSKHTVLILPHTLIDLGLIQYIFEDLRRLWANTIPTVRAAGRAGGTAMVIKSRARRTISLAESPRLT